MTEDSLGLLSILSWQHVECSHATPAALQVTDIHIRLIRVSGFAIVEHGALERVAAVGV